MHLANLIKTGENGTSGYSISIDGARYPLDQHPGFKNQFARLLNGKGRNGKAKGNEFEQFIDDSAKITTGIMLSYEKYD